MKLPRRRKRGAVTWKRLIAALEREGFVRAGKPKGSHVRWHHSDGRRTVTSGTGKTEIGKGLLAESLRQTGIPRDKI